MPPRSRGSDCLFSFAQLVKQDAVQQILAASPAPRHETVPLSQACGRVLHTSLVADRDHPPFNRSTMDGYAVRAAECTAGATLRLVGDLPAGSIPPDELPAGTCIAIATGAAVPKACDAVVEHERTDRGDPVRFDIETVSPGRNIHPQGVDRAQGEVLLEAPLRLGPADIGVAAIAGHAHLLVAQAPSVAIVTTGDELVAIEEVPGPFQLRDSNSPMLAAALRSFGADVTHLVRVPDELKATTETLAALDVDLLITVGGVSQGTRDHIKPAWEALGATPIIERVPIQPGRPTRCWTTPRGVALALPGNPVSAMVCLHLFARPWVRATLGLPPLGDWSTTTLAHDVTPNPNRTLYRAAHVDDVANLASWHGSGDLPHLAATDGIVEIAIGSEPLPTGTPCPFLPWSLD